MKRKLIPVVMMLVAGALCCLFTMIREHSLIYRMTALLCSLVLFYGLGQALCSILNYFDRENEKRLAAEGEIIEKDGTAESGEKASRD
ncbi:MAG: hypothetical protein J6B43_12860 [Lachnospiraceae bacterium]|nr:hypothetical protein [Lachnospiraceae bacterium]